MFLMVDTRPLMIRIVLILVTICAPTDVSWARVGLAENTWQFQHDSDNVVEWHHGDVCGDSAPDADCFFYVPVAAGGRPSPMQFTVPVRVGVGAVSFYVDVSADEPNQLLWGLAGPVGVIVAIALSLQRLHRDSRASSGQARLSARRRMALWLAILVAALSQVGWALGVLFPRPFFGGSTLQFLERVVNVWILISPWVLWRTVVAPPPPQPQALRARLARYGIIVVSGSFASFLVMDRPPSELAFYFPPLLAGNLAISLAVVYALKKARSVMLDRLRPVGG
jgi:hypothetical protein